jgi:hypothetical protein
MKLTLNVPDELLASLRELHASTYAEHRLKFSPWLVDIWRQWDGAEAREMREAERLASPAAEYEERDE